MKKINRLIFNPREKSPIFKLEFFCGDFSRVSQNQNKLHTLVWSKNPKGFVIYFSSEKELKERAEI